MLVIDQRFTASLLRVWTLVRNNKIPVDCRLQASSSHLLLSSHDEILERRHPETNIERFSDTFGLRIVTSSFPLIVRAICTYDTTVQYPLVHRCVILFCYCLALRSPRNSEVEWRLLTSRLNDSCTTTIRWRRGDG